VAKEQGAPYGNSLFPRRRLSCMSPDLEHRRGLLISGAALSAARCLTLCRTRLIGIYCMVRRRVAVLSLASSYTRHIPPSERPAARHNSYCLARLLHTQHRSYLFTTITRDDTPTAGRYSIHEFSIFHYLAHAWP